MSPYMKSIKSNIRQFMQLNYTDEKLAMLLAHAQSGRLTYYSCCCFVGIATTKHALRCNASSSQGIDDPAFAHYIEAQYLPFATLAELAYYRLGYFEVVRGGSGLADRLRRARLIPMIRAEFKRRECLATKRAAQPELVSSLG